MATSYPSFKCLQVSRPSDGVLVVTFNNPKKLNSLGGDFFVEFPQCLKLISKDAEAKVVIINANGRHFTAGIDLAFFGQFGTQINKGTNDPARKALRFMPILEEWQQVCDGITAIPQPVIACVHGACIGGGIDILCGCDMRWCCDNAKFSIKEVDIAIVADLGTLSRMNRIIGNESMMREFAFTGGNFTAKQAKEFGFVSRIYPTADEMNAAAIDFAKVLASKSPIAIRGVKEMCNYALSHTPADCQQYVRAWNSVMTQSPDLGEAAMAFFQKREPKYSKL